MRCVALGGKDKEKKKRGKKVPPGQSYCDEEEDDAMEDEVMEDEVMEDEVREDRDMSGQESDSSDVSIRPIRMRQRGSLEDSDPDEPQPRRTEPDQNFAVGSFVIAMYEGTWYLGQVEGQDPEDEMDGYTCVKYMEKKGENKFLFNHKDVLPTLNTDILLTVDHPVPVSNRGFWGLSDEMLRTVGKLVKGNWSIFSKGEETIEFRRRKTLPNPNRNKNTFNLDLAKKFQNPFVKHRPISLQELPDSECTASHLGAPRTRSSIQGWDDPQ